MTRIFFLVTVTNDFFFLPQCFFFFNKIFFSFCKKEILVPKKISQKKILIFHRIKKKILGVRKHFCP